MAIVICIHLRACYSIATLVICLPLEPTNFEALLLWLELKWLTLVDGHALADLLLGILLELGHVAPVVVDLGDLLNVIPQF